MHFACIHQPSLSNQIDHELRAAAFYLETDPEVKRISAVEGSRKTNLTVDSGLRVPLLVEGRLGISTPPLPTCFQSVSHFYFPTPQHLPEFPWPPGCSPVVEWHPPRLQALELPTLETKERAQSWWQRHEWFIGLGILLVLAEGPQRTPHCEQQMAGRMAQPSLLLSAWRGLR